LVTMNDPVYLEAAYELAIQMETKDKSIPWAYEKLLLQNISSTKLENLESLYEYAFENFNNHPETVEEWLQFAPKEKQSASLAAFAVVANAIMNLDEFLTKS